MYCVLHPVKVNGTPPWDFKGHYRNLEESLLAVSLSSLLSSVSCRCAQGTPSNVSKNKGGNQDTVTSWSVTEANSINVHNWYWDKTWGKPSVVVVVGGISLSEWQSACPAFTMPCWLSSFPETVIKCFWQEQLKEKKRLYWLRKVNQGLVQSVMVGKAKEAGSWSRWLSL